MTVVKTNDDLKFYKDRISHDDAIKVLIEIAEAVGVHHISDDAGDRIWNIYYEVMNLKRDAKTFYELRNAIIKTIK